MMKNILVVVLVFAAAARAVAQDNAVKSATDAFGERVGIEQSGIYSESEVRGFDLNESGAYRIDDAYFSRAAVLDDTILAGAGVRVGVNAARLAYPSPSGVVNYRLREAGPVNQWKLGVGLRDFGTKVIQGDGTFRSGAFSLAGGFLWRPVARYAQGYQGQGASVGAVGAWEITRRQRLRVFGSLFKRGYDGDYAVVPSEAAVPPSLQSRHQYSPDWADTHAVSTNLGVLYRGQFNGCTVDLSAFRSIFDIGNADFTLISSDATGHASATTFRTSSRPKRADSAETRVARQFKAGGFSHLVTLALRDGRTITELTSNFTIPLGAFDLPANNPSNVPEPTWIGTRGEDRVERATASAGYGLAWRDQVQLRLGIHRIRYDKSVLSLAGVRTGRISMTTHYNASAIVALTKRMAVFGSWVTGLEESGTAPPSATNRDEVLPPVEAEQFELGVRHALSPSLNLIGALFDVSKPTQGRRLDGSFGMVGEVRHRGVEASIAGKLDARTHMVVGLVAFQSEVTGPLVDAGVVGSHDVGVSQLVANASMERQLENGWSVDSSLGYLGERWADSANSFKVPAVATLSFGLRRRFALRGRPTELRILGSNLTGDTGYLVARSGLFSPIPPRTVRAVLTFTFGPGRGRPDALQEFRPTPNAVPNIRRNTSFAIGTSSYGVHGRNYRVLGSIANSRSVPIHHQAEVQP